MASNTVAAQAMGGHVRVAPEDNLRIGKSEFACSNAAQVTKMRHIVARLGLVVASPEEARAIASVMGCDKVGF